MPIGRRDHAMARLFLAAFVYFSAAESSRLTRPFVARDELSTRTETRDSKIPAIAVGT